MTVTEKDAFQIEFERLEKLNAAEGEFTPAENIWFRDALLAKWEKSKVDLETAKAAEMDNRKAVVAFAFDPEKDSGTERIELANGYQAKAVKKVNYSVNQDIINTALDKIEALGPEGKFISERLIKWTAALSLTEYKTLDEKYKVIIDTAITTTEGAPTLEIVEPKTKGKL